MKTVLFVCYGSGHVRMVLPVAQELLRRGLAQVRVLGLTTAAPVVRAAGLPLVQFSDVLQSADAPALETGRRLLAAMGPVDDPQESAAYLGLCHAELEAELGPEAAAQQYARLGRQAWLPVRVLERVLDLVRPDLVVTTNSPRAERAAMLAAGARGIPGICMVDLFAVDEVRWIGAPDYGQRVCVLNEAVRDFLVAAGRRPDQVVVTGNPAFDILLDPAQAQAGSRLRGAQGWQGRDVLLWPTQVEPAVHPFDGRPGDVGLPGRVLERLLDWVRQHPRAVLCVRARAGELPPGLPQSDQVVLTGQDWPLPELLHAVDAVVTLTSTVGLEGHLTGARLIQVTGSVFDEAMPLARFGIADACVDEQELPAALDRWAGAGRRPAAVSQPGPAAARVVDVLAEFL